MAYEKNEVIDMKLTAILDTLMGMKLGTLGIVVLALVMILLILKLLQFKIFANQKIITSKTNNLGLKDIGELATQAGYFSNTQQIKNNAKPFGLDIPLINRNYIYSYDGVIKAGIDFAKIKLDVNEENKMITVKMPPVKILSCEVKEDSLVIYEEKKNIFMPLRLKDISEAKKALVKEAEEKAIANGLLENARQNAEILIKGFLSGTFNREEYTYTFVDTRPKMKEREKNRHHA